MPAGLLQLSWHGTLNMSLAFIGQHDCVQVVCAGSQDTFEIFVWSVKTSRLLEVWHSTNSPRFPQLLSIMDHQIRPDGTEQFSKARGCTALLAQVLSGHEGPVAGLAFSPTSSLLASASWDHTLRTWDVFAGKGPDRFG